MAERWHHQVRTFSDMKKSIDSILLLTFVLLFVRAGERNISKKWKHKCHCAYRECR